jgi:hypothetical protein
MTVAEIKALLVSVDPKVQRYDHDGAGVSDAYTVWYEITPLGHYGDGEEEGSLQFQVDRFTRDEDDAIAAQLKETLEAQDDIAVDYRVDYERDTGYIHHIFVCEGC